jgi:hypothetical protein
MKKKLSSEMLMSHNNKFYRNVIRIFNQRPETKNTPNAHSLMEKLSILHRVLSFTLSSQIF